jgi:hypothetical protein
MSRWPGATRALARRRDSLTQADAAIIYSNGSLSGLSRTWHQLPWGTAGGRRFYSLRPNALHAHPLEVRCKPVASPPGCSCEKHYAARRGSCTNWWLWVSPLGWQPLRIWPKKKFRYSGDSVFAELAAAVAGLDRDPPVPEAYPRNGYSAQARLLGFTIKYLVAINLRLVVRSHLDLLSDSGAEVETELSR